MPLSGRWVRRAATFAAACYVGLQIRIPGIRPDWLARDIWKTNDSPLLKFFDTISGHGLTRGSILALSVTPFLAARCYIWLGKKIFPRLAARDETRDGRNQLKRWTRWLNMSIALVQSYGYARFLQGIPNVVVTPGPAFIVGTMALLTTGAVVMMHLSERITVADDDLEPNDYAAPTSTSALRRGPLTSRDVTANEQPALNAAQSVDEILQQRVVLTPDEVSVSK